MTCWSPGLAAFARAYLERHLEEEEWLPEDKDDFEAALLEFINELDGAITDRWLEWREQWRAQTEAQR